MKEGSEFRAELPRGLIASPCVSRGLRRSGDHDQPASIALPLWQARRVALRDATDSEKFAGRRDRAGHRARALRWNVTLPEPAGRESGPLPSKAAACLPFTRPRHHHLQQRIRARPAVDQDACHEHDRQVLAIAADHPDGIGQSACRCRAARLAGDRSADRDQSMPVAPVAEPLQRLKGARNGHRFPEAARGAACQPRRNVVSLAQRAGCVKSQAVASARCDQGGSR